MTSVAADRPGSDILVQRAVAAPHAPSDEALIDAAAQTLAHVGRRGVAALCLLPCDEVARLNERFRGRTGPTNVLSFPGDVDDEKGRRVLGDIILCPDVIEREAAEQDKRVDAHYAHMVVHGTLHLLGFDHVDADEAHTMEAHERQILSTLGIPDPYAPIAARVPLTGVQDGT